MKITTIENPPLNFITPQFSAGKQALLSQSAPDSNQSKSVLTSVEYKRKFLAAMHAIGVPDGSYVKCAVLLPYEWAEPKAELVKQALNGKHTIADKDRSVTFTADIVVSMQGLAACINHAIDWNGKLVNKELLDRSLWLDGGENSWDIVEIKDWQPTNRSFSITGIGAHKAIEDITNGLLERGIDCLPSQVHAALLKGKLILDNTDVPIFQAGRDAVLKNISRRISENIHSELKEELKDISLRTLTGGCGILTAPYMPEYLPGCKLSNNALCDNLHGALKQLLYQVNVPSEYIKAAIDLGFGTVEAGRLVGNGEIIETVFPSLTGEYIKRNRIKWD